MYAVLVLHVLYARYERYALHALVHAPPSQQRPKGKIGDLCAYPYHYSYAIRVVCWPCFFVVYVSRACFLIHRAYALCSGGVLVPLFMCRVRVSLPTLRTRSVVCARLASMLFMSHSVE